MSEHSHTWENQKYTDDSIAYLEGGKLCAQSCDECGLYRIGEPVEK